MPQSWTKRWKNDQYPKCIYFFEENITKFSILERAYSPTLVVLVLNLSQINKKTSLVSLGAFKKKKNFVQILFFVSLGALKKGKNCLTKINIRLVNLYTWIITLERKYILTYCSVENTKYLPNVLYRTVLPYYSAEKSIYLPIILYRTLITY